MAAAPQLDALSPKVCIAVCPTDVPTAILVQPIRLQMTTAAAHAAGSPRTPRLLCPCLRCDIAQEQARLCCSGPLTCTHAVPLVPSAPCSHRCCSFVPVTTTPKHPVNEVNKLCAAFASANALTRNQRQGVSVAVGVICTRGWLPRPLPAIKAGHIGNQTEECGQAECASGEQCWKRQQGAREKRHGPSKARQLRRLRGQRSTAPH